MSDLYPNSRAAGPSVCLKPTDRRAAYTLPPQRAHTLSAPLYPGRRSDTLYAMTEICLIRHGQTDWNALARIQGSTDIPLNETGRAQARATAEMLAGEQWDAIYSSPLSRAFDTARIIAERLDLAPIHTDRELQERHFGAAEGLNAESRRARFGSGPIPGAETWDEVLQRARRMMEKIRRAHPDQRVIVVAHGGVINGLMAFLSDGEIGPGKTVIKNASANLVIWDGEWRIRWYNRTSDEELDGVLLNLA